MQTRHHLLALALVATVIAAILPQEDKLDSEIVEALDTPNKKTERIQPRSHTLNSPQKGRHWKSTPKTINIFYQAPAVPLIPKIVKAHKPAAPIEIQQPVAPALPFSYFGKMVETNSTIAYISNGGRNYAVKGGETIDGIYKIKLVDSQKVVFEYLPLHTEQTLIIRGTN